MQISEENGMHLKLKHLNFAVFAHLFIQGRLFTLPLNQGLKPCRRKHPATNHNIKWAMDTP